MARGVGFTHIVEAVSELMAISPHEVIGPRKERTIVKTRALICHWAAAELGMSMTEIGCQLNVSVSTVSVAAKKGQQIAELEGLKLVELLNVEI